VIATNAPIIDKTSKIYDKQDAYRTYVIGARIKRDAIPTALYWDTGDQKSENLVAPYHYARIQKMDNKDDDDNENYDLLIVGGEDRQAGNFSSSDQDEIEKRYLKLESWTRERFPIEGIEYRWSGQVMEPKDSLAFIGHNPGDRDNIYIATGDSGNGITHGTIAGIILRDLILEKNNSWATLYDPSRKPREVPETKAGEVVQTSSQEKMSTDKSKDENDKKSSTDSEEEIASMENLEEGQGIVLKEKKIAAYKDHKDQIQTYFAECTHLGCTVVWNSFEKSFDCPCHGSRFSPSGNVINGPANNALKHKKK
jgi:Rieske Fe-S protein